MMSSARNVTLSNMEVKNTGGTGILCTGDCRGITVMASDVHDVSHGIYLMGGDYQTLQSSHNVVRDNHIWHNARYGAFSNDAVTIEGVGVLVAHNHIHHGQYAGIKWRGNEHVMEYNHVHHMCWNSSDCGAFFTGRRWNWRGNVIRYNHVHDVLRHFPGSDVRGIMLDDEYSSALVEHNVFYNNDVHVNIGGGRDNVVRENIMYNAERYTMQVDARGLGSNNHGDFMREKLLSSPYRTELWKARYPELYDILDSNPGAPKGNQIYNNVIYEKPGTPETIRYSSGYRDRMDYFAVHDNHRAFSKAEFWSPDVDADFRLRCGAAQWAGHHSFQAPIALDQVGPTVPTGPANLQKQKLASTTTLSTSAPPPCDSTVAPSTSTPRGAYLPDGTSPNTLYPHIPNTGCWLVTDHCPSHPSAQGTHRDDAGTRAGTEEGCLSRASAQWHWCGAPDSGRVVAVYGPTGAMTFSAQGCYFAGWGCRTPSAGSIVHDKWAEQHRNASTDQEACLARAHAEWVYCGSRLDSAFTSVFGPTGAFRTAGGGCWIQIPSCPANPALQGFFFDAWGDSNRMTGTYQDECYDRASYYWSECGSHDDAPVTAFFRPIASKFTMPLTAN
ncbi:uncharacterized protein LOC143302302 [Babylonia areolata]|uniref:uncharacterized protein LOC143302302 n=1 Tax=Babylonia areolata TaxID=304850 RepID=UPI003FD1D20C